ncbi:MAG: hypothetical protein COU47_01435 [Candidatus Niyogibacteria bacterium CG10_big_fil_rev_8_21_14_0_10_46_36]|uniref:Uncharacterized protein n=1 Tax=Candidatus Niyogibacteria bacterium CG10_big_fil_rev_8_21_14_0_10_46_36 TaxID=1974726 RepID=A0A2H0TDV1_9BACT|nr:MAG: hypothetical protein COU47_01435 [Candidatus Niyogibacteria bacterium CG10_big_fil_rev_8_21_14_0_10_46_36]
MQIKRVLYVVSFVVLGCLLQLLIHAGVEMWYISLLLRDFPRFSLGFSWEIWFLIHHIGAGVLFVAGIVFGWWQGHYWWKRIYEKKNP